MDLSLTHIHSRSRSSLLCRQGGLAWGGGKRRKKGEGKKSREGRRKEEGKKGNLRMDGTDGRR